MNEKGPAENLTKRSFFSCMYMGRESSSFAKRRRRVVQVLVVVAAVRSKVQEAQHSVGRCAQEN